MVEKGTAIVKNITKMTLSFVIHVALVGTVLAQSDAPMMVKSESGQPLSEPVQADLCTPDGIAVGGMDVVSYRQENGPVAGQLDFKVAYDGLTYLFKDAHNSEQFRQAPDQYLPEYGGYCAITLALGRVTCPEFDNFKIENDRLLLFEVTGFTNGRTLWNSDPGTFRDQADDNFQKINN